MRKFLLNNKKKILRLIYQIQGKQNIHFIHIGKTGGSAIKNALKKNLVSDKYIIHIHKHNFKLRNIPEGEGVIFFLRDPISRFISGFYSRQRQGQPKYFSPWSKEEKVAFTHFKTPNELALALSSTNEETQLRAKEAIINIRHVKDSFWYWFDNERYFRSRVEDFFFIGFQESLNEDFENLKLKIGLPNNVKLPDDLIQAHKSPEFFDKRLEDEAIENLKNLYEADYKFLNLTKEILNSKF